MTYKKNVFTLESKRLTRVHVFLMHTLD